MEFNHLADDKAEALLLSSCHSSRWVAGVLQQRPFFSKDALFQNAATLWKTLNEEDFLEAFAAHPKIGDMSSLKAKYRNTADTAAHEQSGASQASDTVLKELAALNHEYEAKFGFIFIVCATGKSAEEMLLLLKDRIHNSRADELKNAADEQAKITRLRLEKLL